MLILQKNFTASLLSLIKDNNQSPVLFKLTAHFGKTVIGFILNYNEAAYRKEVQSLTVWCDINNLVSNIKETKEMIVNYRSTKKITHSPVMIKGEVIRSWEFTEDLSWGDNTAGIISYVGNVVQ